VQRQRRRHRGESRHALSRDVCPGHRGELRHASANHQGQEEQLGALGLIVNAIILYNTIYTQRALDHLAAHGHAIDDADVERLTPLGAGHITLDRPLPNRAPRLVTRPQRYRELNTPPALAA